MNTIFRAQGRLFATVRADLCRAHMFAAERVGFLLCSAARVANGGLLILAGNYEPVDDNDYLDDPRAAAMMGPAAIRKAMQRAYNNGSQNVSIFHIHMHDHFGQPGFSKIDLVESRKFVPDFFNVAPSIPHGAIVLSKDKAYGLCWLGATHQPEPVSRFEQIGAPLQFWGGQ